MAKKGGTSFQSPEPPDPIAVAASDFIFNRLNQQTPFSSLQFYAPGQVPANAGQQVNFLPGGLTPQAQALFAPPEQAPPSGKFGKGGSGQPAPDANGEVSQLPGAPAPTPVNAPAPSVGNPLGGPAALPVGPATPVSGAVRAPAAGVVNLPTTGPESPAVQAPASFSQTQQQGGGGGKQHFWQQVANAQQGTGYNQTPQAGSIFIPAPLEGGGFNIDLSGLANATAVQTLPPELLALENARTTSSANVLADVLSRQQDIASNPLPGLISSLNTQGLPNRQRIGTANLPDIPKDIEQFRQDVTNNLFELGASPLREEFGRQLGTIEQRLANQGLALEGEAGTRVLGEFQERQGEALRRLGLESAVAGGQEASRALADILGARGQGFQEKIAKFQTGEAQRAARLGEQVQGANLSQVARTQQINELNALLGLPQISAPGLNSFLQTSPTGVADAFGLNLSGQNARANAGASLAAAQKGGLSQLGGSALEAAAISGKLSDRRLKRNIRRIGELLSGLTLYAFEYLWGEQAIGVMADEAAVLFPESVSIGGDGYARVDYGRIW